MGHEILHEGKYRRFVRKDGWEFVERLQPGGIVVIIAVTDDDKVVLIEQPRIPIGKRIIEFPAGLVNDHASNRHESMEETARRELIEETGYRAKTMTRITEGPASSATTSDILTVFFAQGLTKEGPGGGDETEEITVHEVPLGRVHEWLAEQRNAGRMVDLKIYAGLYYLKHQNSF